jgi:HEAT repeat protein
MKLTGALLVLLCGAQAFGQVSADPLHELMRHKSDTELLKALRTGTVSYRLGAAREVGPRRIKVAVSDLIRALRDRPTNRPSTKLGDPGAEALQRGYRTPNPEVINSSLSGLRIVACRSLADLGDRRAVMPLIDALLHDPSQWVAGQAALSLGTFRDKSAVKPLARALRDPSELIRMNAARGLASIASPDSDSALIAALGDTSKDVRAQAATALGRSRSKRAVPALMAVLSDESAYVRERAARALGLIGDPKAVPALKSIARTTPKDIVNAPGRWKSAQHAAEEAIRALTKRSTAAS